MYSAVSDFLSINLQRRIRAIFALKYLQRTRKTHAFRRRTIMASVHVHVHVHVDVRSMWDAASDREILPVLTTPFCSKL